jgi:hypothetical protein
MQKPVSEWFGTHLGICTSILPFGREFASEGSILGRFDNGPLRDVNNVVPAQIDVLYGMVFESWRMASSVRPSMSDAWYTSSGEYE